MQTVERSPAQGNFYQITGTAVGEDSSGAIQQVSKSFEIDVTCP